MACTIGAARWGQQRSIGGSVRPFQGHDGAFAEGSGVGVVNVLPVGVTAAGGAGGV